MVPSRCGYRHVARIIRQRSRWRPFGGFKRPTRLEIHGVGSVAKIAGTHAELGGPLRNPWERSLGIGLGGGVLGTLGNRTPWAPMALPLLSVFRRLPPTDLPQRTASLDGIRLRVGRVSTTGRIAGSVFGPGAMLCHSLKPLTCQTSSNPGRDDVDWAHPQAAGPPGG